VRVRIRVLPWVLKGEGGRGVGLAASAMAGGFAAAASQGDEGAAQKDGAGGRIG